jgi:hypothetical protein
MWVILVFILQQGDVPKRRGERQFAILVCCELLTKYRFSGNLDTSLAISKIQVIAKLTAKGFWAANNPVNEQGQSKENAQAHLVSLGVS